MLKRIFNHLNVHYKDLLKKTRPIINELKNKVNEIVYKNGKPHYKYVAVDGTIIKAKNSNLNVLKKKIRIAWSDDS